MAMSPIRFHYIVQIITDPVNQVVADDSHSNWRCTSREMHEGLIPFILYSSARFGQHSANAGWPRQLAGASSDTRRRRVSVPSSSTPLSLHICGGARATAPFPPHNLLIP